MRTVILEIGKQVSVAPTIRWNWSFNYLKYWNQSI